MTISNVLKEGVSIGLKNFLSLVGAGILYVLTIWIPYLNIGTTIAIITLPASMSRGEVISPKEIFDPKYRKNMGNFFLLYVLFTLGIASLCIFFVLSEPISEFLRNEVFHFNPYEWEPFQTVLYIIFCIPGIVQCFAWLLAPLLLVDKGLDPIQALNESNLRTDGHKWTIFFSYLVFSVGFIIVYLVLFLAAFSLSFSMIILSAFYCILMLLYYIIQLGMMAVIYRTLGGDTPAVSNEG